MDRNQKMGWGQRSMGLACSVEVTRNGNANWTEVAQLIDSTCKN